MARSFTMLTDLYVWVALLNRFSQLGERQRTGLLRFTPSASVPAVHNLPRASSGHPGSAPARSRWAGGQSWPASPTAIDAATAPGKSAANERRGNTQERLYPFSSDSGTNVRLPLAREQATYSLLRVSGLMTRKLPAFQAFTLPGFSTTHTSA